MIGSGTIDRNMIDPMIRFTELRLPKLSANETIDEEVKSQLEELLYKKSQYLPEEEISEPSFVYIASDDSGRRAKAAACVLNYLSDQVDIRNMRRDEKIFDLHVFHIGKEHYDDNIRAAAGNIDMRDIYAFILPDLERCEDLDALKSLEKPNCLAIATMGSDYFHAYEPNAAVWNLGVELE